MEEVITLILVLLTLLIIFCMYKMLDKRGLYFSLVLINLISFVFSFKISYIFKMNINIGLIPLIATFTIIYIFLLNYNKKDIKHLIIITLCSNVAVALLLTIMNYFVPAIKETISINMQGTFEYNYKILILYPIVVAISQFITVKLFSLLTEIQDNIIVSIVLSYIIVGLIYTVGFSVLSYIEILPIKYSLFLGISNYILGLLITIVNAIYVSILHRKKVIRWKMLY